MAELFFRGHREPSCCSRILCIASAGPDRPHIRRGPAEETVKFGLGGSDYEIDLSTKNASGFRDRIAPYIEHARKTGGGPRRRTPRTIAGHERSGDIRSWAKEHDIHVSERGRIPASVIEQYEAATRNS